MSVHIVVVGCGRVGSGLSLRLSEQGHSVSVVDRNPKAFARIPEEWTGKRIVGSGFDRDVLETAGAKEAGALAAVTSGDNSNILTARIARETYGIANVVARIYDPRRARIYLRLGIPTVATVTWTIDQVLGRLLPETVIGRWTDASGTLTFTERVLPESWAGRKLDALQEATTGIKLVAVTRAGVPRLDIGSLVGQEGDVLHLALLKDAAAELDRRLGYVATEEIGQ